MTKQSDYKINLKNVDISLHFNHISKEYKENMLNPQSRRLNNITYPFKREKYIQLYQIYRGLTKQITRMDRDHGISSPLKDSVRVREDTTKR